MNFNKICIIHLNQIGDLVFSLPLLKALRDNFPGATIHSVVKPYLKELLTGLPYVDRIILREVNLKAKLELLNKLRSYQYDLLISLPRSLESLILTTFSKAKIKAGFAHFPWDLCLDIKEIVEGHNSWHNNAKLLKKLNISVNKNDYIGLITADKNRNNFGLPPKYIVISPGASKRRQTKTWGQHKFAKLIISIKENFGLDTVLVGGRKSQAYNQTIVKLAMESNRNKEPFVVDLTGNTGLRSLCSIIKDAKLFVGIDSGIMHLASSIDIPIVALFGPTDPYYVGPQNHKSLVVSMTEMECVPCYLKHCPHRDCMRKLDVNRVMNACTKLLTQSGT
ncbi:MAG: lipopolysaccharide heptosyltransferase II [Thermodesulfobacteriota bacterium]|nr:lipopolysaccharide heptosyltransferase II [Thermodesulfobacteriota bacterium]